MANGNAKKKKAAVGPRLYRSYRFIDKDPIIDVLRTAKADLKVSNKDIHEASDVSQSTLYNWFEGSVRRPQFPTVAAVVRAMGYRGVNFNSDGKPSLIGTGSKKRS